jgi:hypothetical protein
MANAIFCLNTCFYKFYKWFFSLWQIEVFVCLLLLIPPTDNVSMLELLIIAKNGLATDQCQCSFISKHHFVYGLFFYVNAVHKFVILISIHNYVNTREKINAHLHYSFMLVYHILEWDNKKGRGAWAERSDRALSIQTMYYRKKSFINKILNANMKKYYLWSSLCNTVLFVCPACAIALVCLRASAIPIFSLEFMIY